MNWQELLTELKNSVPKGKVTSYKELSLWAFGKPSASQAISAMLKAAVNSEPSNALYTNRVISDSGAMADPNGQIAQLTQEGIPVENNVVVMAETDVVRFAPAQEPSPQKIEIDHDKFKLLIKQLYATVGELESMFPGRHFTPDGHMVGSIGECLVADAYDLQLMPSSNKGFDATTHDGKEVEIKATQSKSVAFRSQPEHAIVIKIYPDGTFEEIYNGPGALVWDQFTNRKPATNGQYQISLTKLRQLNSTLCSADRLPRNSRKVRALKKNKRGQI
jgi:alkylated DNA nucleotide flippase Atl1